MKFNSIYTLILPLTFALSACSSTPSHVIVAPDIFVTPSIVYQDKQAQLAVVDMRTANHVVQILREGEASTLMSAQERLEETIQGQLIKHWKKQGLTTSDSANNIITIDIEKAVISVTQETMEYKVQTEIVLKVTIKNGEQTLTSTFKNRGNSDGPLRADIAVLERDFNQRLTKVLEQILSNEKISSFLI